MGTALSLNFFVVVVNPNKHAHEHWAAEKGAPGDFNSLLWKSQGKRIHTWRAIKSWKRKKGLCVSLKPQKLTSPKGVQQRRLDGRQHSESFKHQFKSLKK